MTQDLGKLLVLKNNLNKPRTQRELAFAALEKLLKESIAARIINDDQITPAHTNALQVREFIWALEDKIERLIRGVRGR